MLERSSAARAEALILLFGLFPSDSTGVTATLVAGVLPEPFSTDERDEEVCEADRFFTGTATWSE